MKILLISHTCQSRVEGHGKAEHLGRLDDVELRVLIPDRWKHYGKWRNADPVDENASFQADVRSVHWPWAGPAQFYFHWYPQLAKILREFQPDIIDLWEDRWGLVSVQACWLRNHTLPSARIISETEQNIPKSLPPPFEHFRSYVLRNADFAIGPSAAAVEVLRNKGYFGPTEIVPNGVDGDLFHPIDRDSCRAELAVEGFVVGYVGRLVRKRRGRSFGCGASLSAKHPPHFRGRWSAAKRTGDVQSRT